MRYLSVKAHSLIQADERTGLPGRAEDAIRDLSNLLERQVATAASTLPPAPKSGFDSLPPSTKRMILLVSDRDSRVESLLLVDILALSNVAYVQNYIHHFLRNTKGRDYFIPMGFCAAPDRVFSCRHLWTGLELSASLLWSPDTRPIVGSWTGIARPPEHPCVNAAGDNRHKHRLLRERTSPCHTTFTNSLDC